MDGQRVVLVRHGETEWSAGGRHTGRTDVPLNDAGRRRAERLRGCLAPWRFVLVLASPLRRAKETAALAGFASAGMREDLREWDYGAYEGLTTAEIRKDRPGWTVWSGGCPEGETIQEVGARADRLLEEVRRSAGDVALFGHGHLLRVLAARWVGLAPARGALLALDPGTVCVLGYERETPAILRWNVECR